LKSGKTFIPEDFEYSLWALTENDDDWVQIAPYQPVSIIYDFMNEMWLTGNRDIGSAIAQYTFSHEGITSLQINLREMASELEYKLWVNQFYIQTTNSAIEKTFLLRDILLAYQDIYDDNELYNLVANDIKVALGIYYFTSMGEAEKTQAIISGQQDINTKIIDYDYDLKALIYQNHAIYIIPGTIKPLDECINLFMDKEYDFIMAAMVNTVVYNHYEYGSLFYSQRHTLKDWVACCACYAKDCYTLLTNMGFEAKWIQVSNPEGSIHAVCEITFPDSVYTFDPTANVVHDSAAKDIYKAETATYIMPQIRNLDFLVKKSFWKAMTDYDIVLP
jgi:hypothetical protein